MTLLFLLSNFFLIFLINKCFFNIDNFFFNLIHTLFIALCMYRYKKKMYFVFVCLKIYTLHIIQLWNLGNQHGIK